MSDLKPCPFCGGGELSHGYQDGYTAAELGVVQCHGCGAATLADTEPQAIAAWNTRASDPAGEVVEALKPFAELYAQTMRARGLNNFEPLPPRGDDRHAWGFDNADLTWGDFRSAYELYARLALHRPHPQEDPNG